MDANERMTAAQFQDLMAGRQTYRDLQIDRQLWREQTLTERPRFRVESDFQSWLRTAAIERGWLFYHTYGSKRSDPGFPDAVLLKAPFECLAELKMPGEKPTDLQRDWLEQLSISRIYNPRDQTVCLWFPDDEADILRYLDRPDRYRPPGLWADRRGDYLP